MALTLVQKKQIKKILKAIRITKRFNKYIIQTKEYNPAKILKALKGTGYVEGMSEEHDFGYDIYIENPTVQAKIDEKWAKVTMRNYLEMKGL